LDSVAAVNWQAYEEQALAAIAGALVRVLEDPGLADELRRRGLERARGFTWERAADELLGALEEAG